MRSLAVLLMAALALPAGADDLPLRPSAQLLFRQPELLRPGACAMLYEGGGGWILGAPRYWLRGTVVSAEVRTRRLEQCPVVPGKTLAQYTREEFNRHAAAYPCLAAGEPARDAQVGVVRLRVEEWETPYAKAAANAGRLYRGMYLRQTLSRGAEIELEADLLEACL